MPTMTYSRNDFFKLLGTSLSEEQLSLLLCRVKAELETFGDNIVVKFNDTNLPWIWSVEGLVCVLKGLLGLEKGLPLVSVKSGSKNIIAEKISGRPFIAGFCAAGVVSENLLIQLVQLQEKFCDAYGRKRSKIAVGIYSAEKISFPVRYSFFDGSTKFVALNGTLMGLSEILEKHPKGKEYAHIVHGWKKFPLLVDNQNNVLSFPPIINSEHSGRVVPGISSLFFEATGTDEQGVMLACAIFAFALFQRGFELESVVTIYPDKQIVAPDFTPRSVQLDMGLVESVLGLGLSEPSVKGLLEKLRYDSSKMVVPAMRHDIMHSVDVVEDVAIAYGYENITPEKLALYTKGATSNEQYFGDDVRLFLAGCGFQEVFSPYLTSKKLLFDMMNCAASPLVEIDQFYSESYSVVRNSILPVLLEFLAGNKHVDYPQRVFEEGLVCVRSPEIVDYRNVAFVSAHSTASLTEMRQVLDFLFKSIGMTYSVEELANDSCIPGRCGSVFVKNHRIGFFGELHPKVLENFKLDVPVSVAELNISLLHELSNSR
ncbi:phenylalanine--tRNA ligase subunit beta [Candidatus Woesearchaeota archaeon]|nr:phenylalanine--tRNA ligase subunit beta [Candidatus Woesearchaeota archaeon]